MSSWHYCIVPCTSSWSVYLFVLGHQEKIHDVLSTLLAMHLQGLTLFLFGRSLYYELDVDAELQKGSLPAAISLSNKILPAVKTVFRKAVEALQVGN
jgi:hypothetical protein